MYKRMMASPRVLHIVDPGLFAAPNGGGPCTLRQAADLIHNLPQFSHDVLVLGTRRDVQLAKVCGLDVAGALCPPRILPLGARSTARKVLGAVTQQRGRHCVIHGWTFRAAMYGAALLPNLPRVCSLHVGVSHSLPRATMRMLPATSQTRFIASNEAVRHAALNAGVPPEKMRVIPPAVDQHIIKPGDRAALRASWAIDDQTMVIGALCEPTSIADARIAVRVASVLSFTGRKVRMVVHPDATRKADARLWAKRVQQQGLLISDELAGQPWKIAAGLDAAWLIAGTQDSRIKTASCLPLWWSMAAALPVVVENADPLAQIVENRANGLITPRSKIPVIVDRLAQIHDDRAWAAQLGHAAKAKANQQADIHRYAQELAALYRGE